MNVRVTLEKYNKLQKELKQLPQQGSDFREGDVVLQFGWKFYGSQHSPMTPCGILKMSYVEKIAGEKFRRNRWSWCKINPKSVDRWNLTSLAREHRMPGSLVASLQPIMGVFRTGKTNMEPI